MVDEEMVPHPFNSRTRYEPGDDRDIWCKDCEYHRDHEIHKVDAGDAPTRSPLDLELDEAYAFIDDLLSSNKNIIGRSCLQDYGRFNRVLMAKDRRAALARRGEE